MSADDSLLTWLDMAVRLDELRPLDRAFALFLRTLDPSADDRVLAAAALASRELGNGHIGVEVETLLAEVWADPARALALPARAESREWLDALRASPLVAGGDEDASTPMVLEEGRLYLRRYWRYEQNVARAIAARLDTSVDVSPALADGLARLFPATAHALDWQKTACALAARSGFSVITGGPGTGKTTTVVRLLGLLQSMALQAGRPRLRIRLAAPTGKAAARLNESIAGQVGMLPLDEDVLAAIPTEVSTLHRLLGSRGDTRHFVHHRDNPLHVDVLVIDEASMVDLEMMAAVLDALPVEARLVLLGDKDQLSSVEAGAVLGDLCQRAEAAHYDPDTAAWLRDAAQVDVSAWVTADAGVLDQHVAMLRHSHRFGSDSGIGNLAQAVNAGSVAGVRRVLSATMDDVRVLLPDAVIAVAVDGSGEAPGYRAYLERLSVTRPTEGSIDAYEAWAGDILDAFARFQLLCALRQGEFGVVSLNEHVATRLRDAGLIQGVHGWYEGRPVLVTRNDYSLGLMNGDVGIALNVPDDQGRAHLRVAFRIAGNRIRFVTPSRLGAVETVFAMTVHKSQGSEFEHTALVLPQLPTPVLTRELLYTGVTRARRWFTLLAVSAIVDATVQRRTLRASGLRERLSTAAVDGR
ncbi:MAG TPA: exodeoxyribonuclease V subunit alpha [Luteibacter sp.]|jgi:exodeoxyribonuclease V alpha subunit|nr:exodeoxyribonuclease V subunit alpha [Luteibacter sp.]